MLSFGFRNGTTFINTRNLTVGSSIWAKGTAYGWTIYPKSL